ncbi:hypothetical protein pdam_00023030 [Pocillopora damicornis]|uniref:YqaJ viral recombinase domain-containing protein n=1 Tax=Pocillopora damicornis TaxID=46731 RepID=A0A3M6V250_POCDA|nr:hypothetical protein pdam_00023030 [Pocillopora damicornis]
MAQKKKKNVERDLANPLGKENRVFSQWTKNFTKVKDFRFPDRFIYLVGTFPVYNSESLKIYKSLLGYLKFAVKPTEKSKIDDGSATYRGRMDVSLQPTAYADEVYQCEQDEIHVCHIGPPLNRADGGCWHIAAASFDAEANVRFNDLQSCTSGQCMWKKRGNRNEGSLLIQDLQTSGSYDVTLKDPVHSRLSQTEEGIRAFISSDVNVCKEESVQSVHVYSMNDNAKVFVSVITEKVMPTVSKELAIEFLESIPFNDEQAEIINKKTVYQLQSQFWFDQKAGRIIASSFYMKKVGLIVNTLWPFLRASPDGIRICACCQKKLIEVKSMYAKRNLPPHVAAEENLMLVDE